jgi:undecaprenyl pyrophosphate phosphatase UppP
MKRFLVAIPFLFAASNLLAQDSTPTDNAGAAGAIAGMGCSCIIGLVCLGIWIALAIWVYRDAKSRGMDNAVLLTIVTVITGILGLIIYLLMRPKGNLVPCPSCQKKRMEGSAKCPHCGNP